MNLSLKLEGRIKSEKKYAYFVNNIEMSKRIF